MPNVCAHVAVYHGHLGSPTLFPGSRTLEAAGDCSDHTDLAHGIQSTIASSGSCTSTPGAGTLALAPDEPILPLPGGRVPNSRLLGSQPRSALHASEYSISGTGLVQRVEDTGRLGSPKLCLPPRDTPYTWSDGGRPHRATLQKPALCLGYPSPSLLDSGLSGIDDAIMTPSALRPPDPPAIWLALSSDRTN